MSQIKKIKKGTQVNFQFGWNNFTHPSSHVNFISAFLGVAELMIAFFTTILGIVSLT